MHGERDVFELRRGIVAEDYFLSFVRNKQNKLNKTKFETQVLLAAYGQILPLLEEQKNKIQ